jgi:hypothetical protein
MNLLNLFEDDNSTPNPNYAEELAYQIFKVAPGLDTTGAADEVLDYAFDLAVNDLGRKRAHSLFAYDEDFDSDLVNAYLDLQMNAQAEEKKQVTELDKKTLASYAKKAANSMDTHAYHAYRHQDDSDYDKKEKRKQGIGKAVDRLAKEQGVAGGQLNEYLVKAGMPVKDVLALNLFQDFDPQEGAAAQFAEFAEEPMWQQVVRKYAPIANMLKKKLVAQKRPLTDAEAEAVEQTWYDGSDAYDDMEIEYLVDIYNQQIDTLEALLAGNLTDEEFGEGVSEGVTPASVSKVLRLIQRHHSEWFDTYGLGEVEDTVVDMSEMDKFYGMSAEDATALVGQELESLYGQQGVAEADPHKFDSDVDYYAAQNAPAKPRHRGQQSPGVNPDDEAYFREIFRKKREAAAKAAQDGQQGVAEADKKKDDAEPEVRDVALQRAISRAKSDFPTAGTGIEALAKGFMRSQDEDQKSFDQLRQAERKQDQMLGQIAKIDQEQEQEIQGLEQQNSSLASRLQQLQNVNGELEKKLAAMSGRRADNKSSAADVPVTLAPTSSKIPDPIAAKTKTKTKTKVTQPTTSKAISQVAQTLTPPDNPISRMVPQLEPRQKELGFDEPVTLTPKKYDTSKATDVPFRTGADIAKDVKANMANQAARMVSHDPEGVQSVLRQQEMPLENQESRRPEAKYSDKYQDMVARVGQKAREQEKSKPVDIADLARRLAAIEASRKD